MGALGVAAAATALGVVLAASGPAQPTALPPAEEPSVAAPAEPAVVNDCWLDTADGRVSLAGEQAQALTTLAAGGDGARRHAPLARAVAGLGLTADQAEQVTAALLGVEGSERLTCAYARLAVEPEREGPDGLTPRAAALREAWTEVFGSLPAGGFASGGVSTGHVDSSSHYEGRAVDVFFRPYDAPRQQRAGQVFAQWLMAHAQEHGVLSVIYADQIWTSWASSSGWREYVHPSGPTRNPVLRHLDHVHVAVESGRPYRPR